MDITSEIVSLIGQPGSATLEYKPVLPPSKTIAKIVSAFANTNGGYIVLGVTSNLEVNGLSEDFHANAITHKAIDLLSPKPQIHYQYVSYEGKKLYVIKVEKSDSKIYLEGSIYEREGASTKLSNPVEITFSRNGYQKIKDINQQLESYKTNATNAKIRLIEHYQSILKIMDDLGMLLYPTNANTPTDNQEGKVLSRILYSSFVDNFETYLSDLLYEIFLANPATLKSKQQVTIEEVLNCTDLQDFVKYWAKEKLGKLQKGSVKGFIKENKQIRDLEIIDDTIQDEIEKILQIRHLYAHRNGIVDEKFLQFFTGEFTTNAEHQMSISQISDKLSYLIEIVHKIDLKAINTYNLSNS
uniref:AlbA family DNA-binding domain-containing protein n=1 Tax=uncultured Dysgonomonas sp. TaxID=206096 RepID=UPI00258D8DF1|nr:ATP-binding protein [uncultured Dysgonomonas sp.]